MFYDPDKGWVEDTLKPVEKPIRPEVTPAQSGTPELAAK